MNILDASRNFKISKRNLALTSKIQGTKALVGEVIQSALALSWPLQPGVRHFELPVKSLHLGELA